VENKILHGDSLDLLKDMDDNSVDSVVTDPPYGYSFMGKDWDKALPSIDIWKECVRVLKPGGFAFVMSAPRSDVHSRMCLMLEEAGFNIGFTPIAWTYATGFPKASNIGKMVDKRKKGERNGKADEFATYIKSRREKLNLTKGYVDKEICDGSSMYSFYEGRNNENGDWAVYLPTKERYEKLKKLLQMDDRFDDFIDNTVKVVNTKDGDFGYQKDGDRWDNEYKITEPNSDKAKQLDGSYGGFQPKPAWENIIVCMKPLSEKGYLDQAMKDGKGVTWLDDCRVPYKSDDDFDSSHRENALNHETDANNKIFANKKGGIGTITEEGKLSLVGDRNMGRFPANLLVQDDVLNDGKTTKSTGGLGDINVETKFGQTSNRIQKPFNYQDEGSFSRYYDLDSWWEERIQELPLNVQATYPFIIVPKASKAEKNKGMGVKGTGSNTYNKKCLSCGKWQRKQGLTDDYTCKCDNPDWETPTGNVHPTVKPISLMSYLITLSSREDELVLDPFVGSGTTCIAAKLLKRKYLGMEMDDGYVVIAQERIKAHKSEKMEHEFF
jgi:DNA modification methylase